MQIRGTSAPPGSSIPRATPARGRRLGPYLGRWRSGTQRDMAGAVQAPGARGAAAAHDDPSPGARSDPEPALRKRRRREPAVARVSPRATGKHRRDAAAPGCARVGWPGRRRPGWTPNPRAWPPWRGPATERPTLPGRLGGVGGDKGLSSRWDSAVNAIPVLILMSAINTASGHCERCWRE